MDQDFKNQERIQDYLQGNLKDNDLKSFQADLKKDAALREDLAFSQAMMTTLKNKELVGVNHQVKTIADGTTIKPDFDALKEFEGGNINGSSNSLGKWLLGGMLGLGLLFLGLLASGIFNPFTSNEPTNPLVVQHLVPFENVISIDGETNPSLEKGMTAYANKDYPGAIKDLGAHLNNAYDPNVQFYLGLSHLLNKEASIAIPLLERVVDTSAPPVLSVAQWYLSLAYIETEQISAAIMSLEELQANPDYTDKATELLNSINPPLLD